MSNKIKSVSEIKAGMVLLIETELYGNLVREYACVTPARIKFNSDEVGLAISGDKNWFALENFNEEFSYGDTDILEVWGEASPMRAKDRSNEGRELLWSRAELEKPVELTMADVERLVGKKVKIVK